MAAGKQQGAAFIVIYLHGRGGNRLQGINDFTFGGNFNRVKNLAALNGGLYLTPDFRILQQLAKRRWRVSLKL